MCATTHSSGISGPSDTERHQTEEVTTLPACPPLHSSNPLDLAAKSRFNGPRAYYAVHPLENYSFHPIGSQSGYCYPSPEMPTQGARLRLAPGSQFSIRRCDMLPSDSVNCWGRQIAPRTRKNVATRNWRRTI